ncbi:murein biosynthesis integral membrane protein MurJ [Kitasatospora viridis]|uniref:Putative peptidoglycan lipid II flippase n=1 Tax=Kitasatospora viridis TaxID=281105 RepID=A0A561UHI5_9ACTN|nr:murein biosynthesis integral membrane protein MurJ [Kitasatospora viridis]TWF98817.1 putative peptidoglycan lipid II flippase [Kitasatospora viridis]
MSERGGKDRLAEEPDWYLDDTYARDPFAADDPYATEAGPGPYPAPEPPAGPADDTAEPDAAGEPAGAAEPAAEPQALPGQQNEGAEPLAEPVVPASRWARLTAAARARAAALASEQPDEDEDEDEDGAEAGASAAEPAGTAEPDAAADGAGLEREHAEFVGVDALLGPAAGAVAVESGKPFVPVIEFDPPLTPAETDPHTGGPAAPELPDEAHETHQPHAFHPPHEPAAPGEPGEPGDPEAELPDDPAPAPAGRVGSLVNSSAIMAAGTLVSRATGFLRTMVIAAAIGVGTMGDSYSAANTLPTLLYILIGGGALNAVFVPQLVRSMKQDEDGGTAYANRLLTLVMAGLAGVVFVAVLAAPLLVQLISHSLMSDQADADATVALARYCLPTIFFMGVHVVMGQILNARGRFGAMMWTPVLNNVVVIFTFAMYIWVFGTFQHSRVAPQTVSPEGLRLLGLGTLLGLVVQALSMVPYLRAAGFRYRPRFDWRGHGLGKAARLAKWTFLFVLANQAGYLVVTQLATAAGSDAADHGYLGVGLAAYSNALLIWQLPMAVITVSVMSAVLPRLSRSAADGDSGAVRDDLSYGLRTSAVAIVPAAFLFLALGPQIGGAIYGLGNGGAVAHATTAVGYMLSAFALGLIPYSVQYVLLRGFYAYEDTRTPFSNTVWVAVTQAGTAVLCYLVLPAQWAVTGMALGYGTAYAVGVAVAVPKLKRKVGGLDTGRITKTYVRLVIACLPAALVGFLISLGLSSLLSGWLGSVLTVALAGAAQLAVFAQLARRMRIEELNSVVGMVRSRLGR